MEVEQYEIILVNLDPTQGSEIKKTRPCLVLSPNEMNKFLRTIVIAPMTSSIKPYPTRVIVHHNRKKGSVAIDQIRTIDKKRVLKKLGQITKKEIIACKSVLRETFVD
ncbi:MAG TPA: type II toxin-antitoxin system PemK/MazF family toxin [Cryomorphaceae bacterium]|nr:type II toxin-antitoxin system PemK/MazF family toxin [Cryomorphaceae bacterium]